MKEWLTNKTTSMQNKLKKLLPPKIEFFDNLKDLYQLNKEANNVAFHIKNILNLQDIKYILKNCEYDLSNLSKLPNENLCVEIDNVIKQLKQVKKLSRDLNE